jgi:hypothetical protein
MMKNNTNKDFSMLEDTIDITHVNLSHIFYDPDTEITLDSPSHPLGVGSNIDMEIMNNNTVKFMPHPDFFGSEVFNFSATDIDLNTLYWEVNVTVLPVNDPPVIGIVPDQEWDQDEVVNISLSITDVDDTEFTFYDNTDLFDINPLFYGFNFTPTNSQVGEYQININVSDGKINGSITFNATIMNINDPPLIEKVNEEAVVPDGFLQLSAEEDTLNYYTVFATDIDHDIGIMDVLEFTTNVSDSSFSIDSKTGNISFFPLQEHVGIFYVTIIVSDGNGGSDEQKVNFTVQNINDPPEFLGMGATVTNLTVDCSIYGAYDEDGDPLNYTWSFDDGTNTTTTEPNCDHEYSNPGIYNISVMVSDGNGGITIGNVFVNIETQDPGNGTNGTGNGTNGNGNGNGSKVFVDLDNDDLNDSWEEYYFGNLSQGRNEDFDKDGYSNYEEYLAGTDPTKNTDRPFDKKDDSKGDGDKDSGETLPLLYLVGIIGLVNLILIIIIILFIFMRKKQPGKAQPMDARVRGRHGAERKISCTYCGEPVFEHTRECPNCGEEFDLDFEGYDEEYFDSKYPEDGQTARGGRGRDEYPDWDKDYDYEREETEMEYDDEDYLEEDVEEYDEDYDEEELDEDYEDYEDEDYEETETTEWDDEDSEEYEEDYDEDYDEDYEEEYDDEDYEE